MAKDQGESISDWAAYCIVMLTQGVFMVLGWLLLIPFCYLRAWETHRSDFDAKRIIDRWTWGPLNAVYGQPEDGVSGTFAIVKGAPFMPNANPAWRAYVWSALRNSCDQLKYVFAWEHARPAPFYQKRYKLFGHDQDMHFGWQLENGYYVPVLALW